MIITARTAKPDPRCLQNERKIKNQRSFEKNNLTKIAKKTLEVCRPLLSTLVLIFNLFSEERAGQARTHHHNIHDALAISGKAVGTEYCSRVLLGSWSWLTTHDVMESVSFHFPHDAVKGEDTKCPNWEPVQLSSYSLQFTTLS